MLELMLLVMLLLLKVLQMLLLLLINMDIFAVFPGRSTCTRVFRLSVLFCVRVGDELRKGGNKRLTRCKFRWSVYAGR